MLTQMCANGLLLSYLILSVSHTLCLSAVATPDWTWQSPGSTTGRLAVLTATPNVGAAVDVAAMATGALTSATTAPTPMLQEQATGASAEIAFDADMGLF